MAPYTNKPEGTYIGDKFYANQGNSDSAMPSKPVGNKAKAPATTPTSNSLPKGYQSATLPTLANQKTNSQINPTTGVNANGSTTAPNYTPPNQGTTGINQGGVIGNLINQSNGQNPQVTAAYKNLQDLQNSYATQQKGIQGEVIPLEFQQGRQQVLGNQYGTQLQAAQTGITNAVTQAGQQITAGTNAGNLNKPEFGVSPGTGIGAPSTGKVDYSSSPYGSGVQASSNIQSVKDAQSTINNISQYSPQITTNISRAIDLASTAHLDQNSPFLTGIQHAIASGLVTSQALTAFNSAVSSLNDALQQVGEQPIDPSTITPAALNQLMQTIPNNLKVKSQGAQDFMSKYSTGGNSSGAFSW